MELCPLIINRSLELHTDLSERIRYQLARRPGIWIPIAYALTLLLLSPAHSLFNEWGGVMQYFAGREILAGAGYHGWPAGFWPPFFSFLIGLGSMVLPAFLAGKLISIAASAILLYIAYCLAMELLDQKEVGLGAQAFLALNPLFFRESLQSHNHMLDSLLFVSGLWFFLRSLRHPGPGKFFVVGLVCGLAGLSRYTSYVLLFLPFFLILFGLHFRKVITLAITFWVGFSLVSLPWWYSNAVNNGSPLYSWQHLNICAGAVVGLGGTNYALWRCYDQSNINSVLDVITTYPIDYLNNFLRNIFTGIKFMVKYGGALALFVVPAIFESIFLLRLKHWLILVGELSLWIILVSQAFVNDYFLLSPMVFISIVSVAFVLRYLVRLQEKYPALRQYHFRNLSVALLVAGAFILTAFQFSSYLDERYSYVPLADADEVTRALKEHDPNIKTKVIMAIDPGRAYYAGSKYLVTPSEYEGSVDGMVSYRGLSERVKMYAPKYPPDLANSDLKADYLIYTRPSQDFVPWVVQDLPQFSFLFDPDSDKIPENFKLVYHSAKVVVYEIDWGGR
jgi:hypothetical protein